MPTELPLFTGGKTGVNDMKFGIFLLCHSPEMEPSEEVYGRAIEQAEVADELGFDSVWLAEHHFSSYGYDPNPLMMAVKLADQTKRVRIGVAVMVVPLHHPLRLAEEIAMADVLTGGRLDVGVGRGYQPFEFSRLGVPIEENRERFDEYMDIITRCFTEDGLSYNGKHFQFPETRIFPKPVQHPHPPLWHAGNSSHSVRLAAERGYHCVCSGITGDLDKVAENSRLYHEILDTTEWGPREFGFLQYGYLSRDPEKARAELEHAMFAYRAGARLANGTERVVNGKVYPDPIPDEPSLESLMENVFMLDTPEECAKRVERLRDKANVSHLIFEFCIGALEQDKVLSSMELFAKEVIPTLRETSRV